MATIPGVADGDLIRTTWGDAVADELNGNCVKKTGATMTGALLLPTTQSTATTAAVHKDYVDDRFDIFDTYADNKFVVAAGDTMTGALYVGGNPVAAQEGVSLAVNGRVSTHNESASSANLWCERSLSAAIVVGQPFAQFMRAGALIGQITIASASTVAYGESSDPRLKEQTGDAADAADLVHDLGAKAYRGRWIADGGDGEEWVFLNSTDVAEVAPYAVTGEPDAVDGNGNILAQQVNYPALVPMLYAALSQALDRIAALEEAAA